MLRTSPAARSFYHRTLTRHHVHWGDHKGTCKGSTINHLGGGAVKIFAGLASGFNFFIGEPPVSIFFSVTPD